MLGVRLRKATTAGEFKFNLPFPTSHAVQRRAVWKVFPSSAQSAMCPALILAAYIENLKFFGSLDKIIFNFDRTHKTGAVQTLLSTEVMMKCGKNTKKKKPTNLVFLAYFSPRLVFCRKSVNAAKSLFSLTKQFCLRPYLLCDTNLGQKREHVPAPNAEIACAALLGKHQQSIAESPIAPLSRLSA
jgi:hypothetical protein